MARDYSTAFFVEKSPQAVFDAINDVRAWWGGEIDGPTAHAGDEFSYRYKDLHESTQKVTKSIPGQKVVWQVTKGAIKFISNTQEWTGTTIVFDIAETKEGTKLTFTHRGLSPDIECYDACSDAWFSIIGGSLKALVETGEPVPHILSQTSE